MAQVNQKRKADDSAPPESEADPKEEEEEEEASFIEVDAKLKTCKEEEDEEKLCRFCFDGEGETEEEKLIAPCDCKGGQKYIHLSCLRQWQRLVLVSQPTHPEFWEDDVRHQKCNVCKADYLCAPPTRRELMLGFTGPEIAALIEPHCLIASHQGFNRTIQDQIEENPLLAQLADVQHWLRGMYLITKVEQDKGDIEYPVLDSRDKNRLLKRLDDDFVLELADGTEYQLQPEGPLLGRPFSDKKELKALIAAIGIPCYLVFRPTVPVNCTDDKVAAVNLTRPFNPLETLSSYSSLKKRIDKSIKEANAQDVHVTYYKGGPCEDDQIVTCLVLGGRRTGYTMVHRDFRTALLLAKRNAAHAQQEGRNHIAVGQDVVLQGLLQRPDLNGRRGLVQAFDEKEGRFEVRLLEQQQQPQEDDNDRNEQQQQEAAATPPSSNTGAVDIKRVKPNNLIAHASGMGQNGAVLAFVGDARWTRVQLLGEIAKTSWGLCQAQTSDLFRPADERYDAVVSRLVYSNQSEMAQEHARDNMIVLRRGAMEAAQYVLEDDD